MANNKLSKKQALKKIKAIKKENEFLMSQELERLIRSWGRKGIPMIHSAEVMTDFFLNFALEPYSFSNFSILLQIIFFNLTNHFLVNFFFSLIFIN